MAEDFEKWYAKECRKEGIVDKEEAITKAAQTADLLLGDLRDAHKAAREDDPVLAILLLSMIEQAAILMNRLKELDACFK